MVFLKRAVSQPSFFLILAFIIIIPTSIFTGWIIWWCGAACLVVFLFKKADNPFPSTLLSIAFLGFIIILGLSYYFISQAYHGEVIFYLLFFALPFIIFSRLDALTIDRFFKGSLFIFSVLVVWGIFQHFTGLGYIVEMGRRANAIFYTPNTFATGINIFLLSLIPAYLLGVHSRYNYIFSMLFFAGLLATQSRGGYLGLGAGLFFLVLLIGIEQHKKKWLKLFLGFAIVFLIFQVSPYWSLSNVKATILEYDSAHRWELYSIAWEVIKTKPLLGYGFFNFGYLFQRYKIPPFLDSNALFVHNDYLQIWAEAGIIGLLSLVVLILVFYLTVIKNRKSVLDSNKSLWLCACGASVSSIFVHALVDFPLYVPALQFLLGAYLGALNGIFRDKIIRVPHFKISFKEFLLHINIRYNVFKSLAIVIFLIWLLQPVIAQHVFENGVELFKDGDIKGAVKQLTLAQRLVPGNAYYYWTEGTMWRDQALKMQNNDLADIADSVFAKGMIVNPYYPNNFLERIRLHRDFSYLIKKPADNGTITEWATHIYVWNPNLRIVKLEYAKTLAFLGEKKQAAEVARALQRENPDSKMVKSLIEDFKRKKIL